MPKIFVDANKCEGCGSCAAMYPELFEIKEDGKSYVKENDFTKFGYSAEELVSICPVAAIKAEE